MLKLFKIKNEDIRTMSMISVVLCELNCEHISHFFLIAAFEQVNVCRIHIEKANAFEGKVAHIMFYVAVF